MSVLFPTFTVEELAALITADTKGLGLVAELDAGSLGHVTTKLNDPTIPNADSVKANAMQTSEFSVLVDGGDLANLSTNGKSILNFYMSSGDGQIQIGEDNVQEALLGNECFNSGDFPTTHNAILAASRRPGSVMEAAFGRDVRVNDDQVAAARDYIAANP